MKKLFLILLVLITCIGCAKFFKKTDDLILPLVSDYVKAKNNIEIIIVTVELFDESIYPIIKETYYANDTFTAKFNDLDDTQQKILIESNKQYTRIKKEYPKIKADIYGYENKIENTFAEYEKVRNTAIQTENMIKEIPSLLLGLKGFIKK